MNVVQSLIDRELGIYTQLNYDNVLKRLIVHPDESFYGLQTIGPNQWTYDSDPPIFACRFCEASGYENILALANEDGKVAIQDTTNAKTAQALETFQCHNNAVFDLAWMPDHMNFVTVSGDHTACLWDCGGGGARRVQTFAGHSRSVKTVAFRPGGGGGAVFATGARDGHVLVWDARAPARPDNRLAACHAGAGAATPPAHKRARRNAPRAVSITGLVFQDENTLLSCGECDGNIKAWDLRKNYSGHTREPLPRHAIPYPGASARLGYSSLAVDAARARLYASCMDGAIYRFHLRGARPAPDRRYLGHDNDTFYIRAALSPDGRYLVSGSSDKRAYLWNVSRAAPAARLAAHRAEVTCAAWGAAGALVTCGDDARHHLWRVGAERPDPAVPWAGRAEPPPPAAAPPTWPPAPPRRAKRCLAALLDATEGPPAPPRACKRPRDPAPPEPREPPTRDLPDWVREGAAPHLRLMSPPKKRPDTTDWLTRLVRARRAAPAPASPPRAPAPPARRPSLDRPPRPPRRGATLLNYFTVEGK